MAIKISDEMLRYTGIMLLTAPSVQLTKVLTVVNVINKSEVAHRYLQIIGITLRLTISSASLCWRITYRGWWAGGRCSFSNRLVISHESHSTLGLYEKAENSD